MSTEDQNDGASGEVLARLSECVVRCLRDYTGRGPMRARAILNGDVAVVVAYDTLTKGERVLADHGGVEDVLAIRRRFQQAMRPELRAQVESVLGRQVLSVMSTNSTDPDCSVELFLLGGPLEG
ncbi:Na-translocating system protein MpsC family protein [Patulibacter sp. SYSU D01012]|uniref:Na-translocating system protein MpsC family protein n=1 Tax=Patulibacter sp. SYSU D01012 TaxID=2817381 RepID=UPI001B307447